MSENVRRFTAGPDPFGRVWEVEFKWHQTAISIRHADTVDVKYLLWTDGEPPQRIRCDFDFAKTCFDFKNGI